MPAICDPAVEASTCQGVTFANSCGVADACQGMRPTCPNPESVCSGQTYTGCGGASCTGTGSGTCDISNVAVQAQNPGVNLSTVCTGQTYNNSCGVNVCPGTNDCRTCQDIDSVIPADQPFNCPDGRSLKDNPESIGLPDVENCCKPACTKTDSDCDVDDWGLGQTLNTDTCECECPSSAPYKDRNGYCHNCESANCSTQTQFDLSLLCPDQWYGFSCPSHPAGGYVNCSGTGVCSSCQDYNTNEKCQAAGYRNYHNISRSDLTINSPSQCCINPTPATCADTEPRTSGIQAYSCPEGKTLKANAADIENLSENNCCQDLPLCPCSPTTAATVCDTSTFPQPAVSGTCKARTCYGSQNCDPCAWCPGVFCPPQCTVTTTTTTLCNIICINVNYRLDRSTCTCVRKTTTVQTQPPQNPPPPAQNPPPPAQNPPPPAQNPPPPAQNPPPPAQNPPPPAQNPPPPAQNPPPPAQNPPPPAQNPPPPVQTPPGGGGGTPPNDPPTCADSNGVNTPGGRWFSGCAAQGCTTNFGTGHLSASIANCCNCTTTTPRPPTCNRPPVCGSHEVEGQCPNGQIETGSRSVTALNCPSITCKTCTTQQTCASVNFRCAAGTVPRGSRQWNNNSPSQNNCCRTTTSEPTCADTDTSTQGQQPYDCGSGWSFDSSAAGTTSPSRNRCCIEDTPPPTTTRCTPLCQITINMSTGALVGKGLTLYPDGCTPEPGFNINDWTCIVECSNVDFTECIDVGTGGTGSSISLSGNNDCSGSTPGGGCSSGPYTHNVCSHPMPSRTGCP